MAFSIRLSRAWLWSWVGMLLCLLGLVMLPRGEVWAATVTLQGLATGSTTQCRYGKVTYDGSGNVTVFCAGVFDGGGTLTVQRDNLVEGQYADIVAACGTKSSGSLYLLTSGASQDSRDWTESSAILDCSSQTTSVTRRITTVADSIANPERQIQLVLSDQAAGGATLAVATLTVRDDMALLNALVAPVAAVNTGTAMTVTGFLGATPAGAGYQKLAYGDLYWDATGKWSYVEVPGRATLTPGNTASDSHAVPLQGSGTKSITVTLYGANAATPPGAPVIGTASQAGAAAISIAFGPPASWGTTGTGAAAGSGNPVAYTATCGAQSNTGSASPITVSGLTPGGTYACTVVATNSAGQQGPASATSNSVTLAATVPGAPSLTRLVPGDSSIKVFFTAPVSNGGATITGYTATCTAAGGGSSKSASGLESPLTVTGLVNGTSYNCTVHATNSAGNSTESTAKTAVAGRKLGIVPILMIILE